MAPLAGNAEKRLDLLLFPTCGIRQDRGRRYAPLTDTAAGNEIACAMQSQAYVAGPALGQSLAGREYLKTRCARTTPDSNRPQSAQTVNSANLMIEFLNHRLAISC